MKAADPRPPRRPTVLTIFRRMKETEVGEILPLMNRERAIALTQALAEQR